MFCAFRVLGSRQENKQKALTSRREEPGRSNDCLSGTKGPAEGHLQCQERQSQPRQVGVGTEVPRAEEKFWRLHTDDSATLFRELFGIVNKQSSMEEGGG